MKLKILGIEQAAGQTGQKYLKVATNKGNMSSFQEHMVEPLMEAWRDKKELNLNCVPSKDGKYMNIRGFAMDDDEGEEIDRTQMKPVKPQEFGRQLGKTRMGMEAIQDLIKPKSSAYEKDPVGLAVEVFNSLVGTYKADLNHEGIMKLSINLVKQAQKGFR